MSSRNAAHRPVSPGRPASGSDVQKRKRQRDETLGPGRYEKRVKETETYEKRTKSREVYPMFGFHLRRCLYTSFGRGG